MKRRWILECPQCRKKHIVPWLASWACPVSQAHQPIRVRELK
jgi:hypothetical protein